MASAALRQCWHVRPATELDDAELVSLEADAPQPGVRPVYRTRSFFGRARLYEHARTLVASRDGVLAGAASGAVKRVRLDGRTRVVGHVFNVRVALPARRAGAARALIGELEAWFASEAAVAAYCLVGERNEASRRLFGEAGYRDIARAAYLVIRPPRTAAPGSVVLVDVAADSRWAARIVGPHMRRDFCPANVRGILYARHDAGGYLGTLITGHGGGTSWLSAWDKDSAIGRDPVAPPDRSVFLYDLRMANAEAWRVLSAAVFDRWPWAGRAVVFTEAANVERFGLDRTASPDRVEIVMARLPPPLAADRPYLDVRD
jgi:ribosomal protein S18 acetylase RimI-like enzyme